MGLDYNQEDKKQTKIGVLSGREGETYLFVFLVEEYAFHSVKPHAR